MPPLGEPETGDAQAPSPGPRRWLTQWLLIFAVWTVLGLLYVLQARFSTSLSGTGQQWPLSRLIGVALVNYWIWALLTPMVLAIGRRFPFQRDTWVRPLLAHCGGALLATGIHAVLRVGLYPIRHPSTHEVMPVSLDLVKRYFLLNLYEDFWMYATVLGLWHAVAYYRRYREREMRESQLQAQLARAQLLALKMQLQPHFLFNTLHAISTLMGRDVPAAKKMLVSLSDVLRIALENVETQEVSLKQELEFLGRYLEIEKTRFQDRLTIEFDVGAETLDALLPNMLLQPLVENAVRHGVCRRPGPGRITIRAQRRDSTLELRVEDNGPGLNGSKGARIGGNGKAGGVGLANTRARLQQLYGDAQRLELQDLSGGGLNVRIEIPFHLEQPERIPA